MAASLHEESPMAPMPDQETQPKPQPQESQQQHQQVPNHDASASLSHFSSAGVLTQIPTHTPAANSPSDEEKATPITQYRSQISIPDAMYERFTDNQKISIVFVLSVCAFLTPMASTTVLAAVPEVAAEYGTTGTIIDLSNALYLVFMGISPCFWGPLSQIYGRRIVSSLVEEEKGQAGRRGKNEIADLRCVDMYGYCSVVSWLLGWDCACTEFGEFFCLSNFDCV